jgi:membrane-associated protease RseP (regulator of RpoE activity)
MTLLPQFLAFALTLALMLLLSRWISRQVQIIGLRVSGDMNVAIMAYYLLMFPGIVLHELSHYLMARLLRMQVGSFALGPKKRRNAIELGSVTVASGGSIRDSLVGLAPFLAGTAVLLLVSYYVFDVAAMGEAWRMAGWTGVLAKLNGLWRVPDFWLWAYLIFVVSNSMTPSEADRQPWVVAGVYLGIALLVVWLFGGISALADVLHDQVAGALQVLTLGFLFTLVVNVVIAVFLWLTEAVVIQAQRPLGK